MIVIRINTREHISPGDELEWRRWQEADPEFSDPIATLAESDLAEVAELVMMPPRLR